MNKTLLQWQDYYAIEKGYKSIDEVLTKASSYMLYSIMNEAAEAYARELCEAQKEICQSSVWSSHIYKEYREDVKNNILQAPNACDKTK